MKNIFIIMLVVLLSGCSTNLVELKNNSEEIKFYQDYSKIQDDKLLEGLEPLEIFKMFVHALNKEDYEVAWTLLNEEDWTIDKIAYSSTIGKLQRNHINKFKERIEDIIEEEYDDIILLKLELEEEDNMFPYYYFRKNINNVWKLSKPNVEE